MAVMQMKKICICALKNERKPILEQIQRSGVIDVQQVEMNPENSGFSKLETQISQSGFERNAATIESALDVLAQHAPEAKGLLDSLKGRELLEEFEYKEVIKKRELAIKYANEILEMEKLLLSRQADIVKIKGQIEALKPWLDLDVEGQTTGTAKTAFLYGSIQSCINQEELYQFVEANGNFPEASDVRVFYQDKNQTCIVGFCMREDEVEFENALRAIGFSRPPIIITSIPEKTLDKWNESLVLKYEAESKLKEELTELASERHLLKCAADYFRSRAVKYEVLGNLYQSKYAFILTGYIPAESEEKLVNKLKDSFTVAIELLELDEKEEAPVLLKNDGFSAPVEGVVESFGLPKRGEIDPSAIMAFFYYFLFGMMLSDAAYGLIIVIGCFAVIKSFPRMEKSLKKSLYMFLYCGISTTIWGILFGGFFGDVVTIFSETFLHNRVEIKPLWFAPIDDPMKLLAFSMLIGMIHMFVGLFIKAYSLLREKKYMDCIYDVGFWLLLLVGLVLMLVSSEMFSSIFKIQLMLSDVGMNVVYGITIAGAVGILFMSGRRKKNKWPLRLALGAYDLYNVTGWLSDVLSYSRLLALGLATGVIASVVNLMGAMMGDGIFGLILFIVVFIIGHTLNIAINVLGAYVHTNRLQYVEFFGKFYEGGAEPFKPFKLDNRYVDLEDIND